MSFEATLNKTHPEKHEEKLYGTFEAGDQEQVLVVQYIDMIGQKVQKTVGVTQVQYSSMIVVEMQCSAEDDESTKGMDALSKSGKALSKTQRQVPVS